MENILPLPAREPLLPDESLVSLIRRTAHAMGYEKPGRIRTLLKASPNLPPHWNHLQPERAAQLLEVLLRQSRTSLLGATVHSYGPRLMLVESSTTPASSCDSKTILKYFQSAHPPICPICLQEDKQPYERLNWSLRATPICLRHRCFLTSMCPICRRKLQPNRCDVQACCCGFNFRGVQPIPISNAALKLLSQLSQWFAGAALPLSPLPSCAVLWWLERLTSAVRLLPEWAMRTTAALSIDSSAPVDQVVWLAAADILDEWPQKFFTFLGDFQRVTKHRTTATGLSRSFGLLLREAKHLEDLGHSLPADALREFLTSHYTAGHLTTKACLFSAPQHARLLANRSWISLTEADELLRFRKGGSAALLQRGILTGSIHSARPGHRTVGLVTRESVGQVAHDLKTALSAAEVRELLGMGRVHELIKADLLRRAVWTKGGWRVPRASVNQLLDSVSQSADNGKSNDHWLDIRAATRQFGPSGLNLVRLLRLMQAGQVQVRRSANGSNLCDLLVSAPDLQNARTEIHRLRDEEDGFPLNRLSKVLFPGRPIKEVVLKKWIGKGLLHASRRGRAWAVAANEIARFRAEYCLLETAAQLLQIHHRTLLRWISEGALDSVYGPRSAAGGGFYLLRQSDVKHLRTLAPASSDSRVISH